MNESRARPIAGPLTALQHSILQRVIQGERMKQIARDLGCSPAHVSRQTCLAATKMGVDTTPAAVARYRTHQVWRETADMLEGARIPVPLIDADVHVNHVLDGLAALCRERAGKILPS